MMTRRPEGHLLLYHGVLVPHARWRPQVVGFGRSAAGGEVAARRAERGASRGPRYWAAVVGKFLAHLGLLHPGDSPGPALPSADLPAATPSQQ